VVDTSNKPFARSSEVFDDPTVAAAMIDRLVHTQKWSSSGDNCGLQDRDVGRAPSEDNSTQAGSIFTAERGHDSGAVDLWRVLRVARRERTRSERSSEATSRRFHQVPAPRTFT
jgi:hypothetical protein